MAPALTPALALDYLRELSVDVHAAVVLDGGGALMAGAKALAAPARDLLAAAGAATEVVVSTHGRVVLAARSPGHALVVVCGPNVLTGLGLHDLRTALEDLAAA